MRDECGGDLPVVGVVNGCADLADVPVTIVAAAAAARNATLRRPENEKVVKSRISSFSLILL
jgi:hypothetical protein